MAIEKKYSSDGGYIKQEGDYRVQVSEILLGNSRKGDPMLTITFATSTEKKIKSYFVKDFPYHVHQLNDLKEACGLERDCADELLADARCGIKVEAGEPNEKGQKYMQIVGYGPEKNVEDEVTEDSYDPSYEPANS